MRRLSQTGYLLIVIGVGIGLLSLRVGGTTQRACPGIDSTLYELVRVHPSGVRITGFEFTTATLYWYDGCNWRTNSLVPAIFGLAVSVMGVGIVHSDRAHNSEMDQ